MKFWKWLDTKFEETLMAVGMWAIVIVMGIQVIMRYVFASSLAWSEEISRYIFIWFTFFGISYAIRNNSHIRIDILQTTFPKLEKPMEIIGDIFFFAFCVYMIGPSITTLKGLWKTWQTSPAMEIPMFFVYISLLFGFILSILRLLQKYYMLIFKKRDIAKELAEENKEKVEALDTIEEDN
ncbi:MAG: TRAP transporter small permease [Eubacteriales bacterium]|nr:TRAP transporter small permease [Eubacteriales bacterium]